MKSDIVDLDLILVHRTTRAILVKEDEGAEGVWLPLSRVEVDGEVGGIGTVSMRSALAIEKGLV